MVVEFLSFRVPADERDRWLDMDAEHWTAFLEKRPGFVRKEVWVDAEDPEAVTAVIWWRTLEEWRSIPQEELDTVIERMGPYERSARLTTFDVVRTATESPK